MSTATRNPSQLFLRLPDIPGAMASWELRIHPRERQLTKVSNEWFASYKLLPPNTYTEWARAEFAMLGAYCYPDADDARMKLCMDYTSILFSYDDLMDIPGEDVATMYMHDRHGAEKAAKLLMHVFKNPEEFKPIPGLPVITTFHDFWVRFCEMSTSQQQRRFIDTCEEYVRAAGLQVVNREDQTCPTIEDYIEHRRHTSAIWNTIVFVEWIYEIDVPEEAYQSPALRAVSECANDIVSWANDIYSFNNEQARGDCHNLVSVIAINKGVSVQEAIDEVYTMIVKACDRFWSEAAKIPSYGPEKDKIVKQYLKGLELYTVGNIAWHVETERYLGSEVREIRQTRLQPVKPMEEGVVSPFNFRFTREDDETNSVFLPSGSASPTSAPPTPTMAEHNATFFPTSPSRFTESRKFPKRIPSAGSKIAESVLAALLFFFTAPVYLTPLIPLILLLFLPSPESIDRQ